MIQLKERLELSVSELRLPTRIINRLQDCGIFTVENLLHKKPQEILEIPQFGDKALSAIYVALEEINFYRKGHKPNAQSKTHVLQTVG